jgi:Fe-S cluster assembly scaffold protein SufB
VVGLFVAYKFACMEMQPLAHNARNFWQCDSMLIGDEVGANTYSYK